MIIGRCQHCQRKIEQGNEFFCDICDYLVCQLCHEAQYEIHEDYLW